MWRYDFKLILSFLGVHTQTSRWENAIDILLMVILHETCKRVYVKRAKKKKRSYIYVRHLNAAWAVGRYLVFQHDGPSDLAGTLESKCGVWRVHTFG